jgi:hypothetical protein
VVLFGVFLFEHGFARTPIDDQVPDRDDVMLSTFCESFGVVLLSVLKGFFFCRSHGDDAEEDAGAVGFYE